MIQAWLEITLHSELCAATGDSIAGMVDTDIATEAGLPIIPSKRIKGCLRAVGQNLLDWGIAGSSEMNALFGTIGQQHGGLLQVHDAHLYEIPDKDSGGDVVRIEDYDRFLSQAQSKSQQKQQNILNELTELRTRTAMDPISGTAQPHSLRTIRVLHKGIVLRSQVIIQESLGNGKESDKKNRSNKTKNYVKLLTDCVNGLRGIGLGNTRGLGEVSCQLIWINESHDEMQQEQLITPILSGPPEKITELPYTLHLDQPVLIPGQGGLYYSSANCIPGSAMLGALAGMYINQQGLGGKAHTNEDFARIFLNGGVQFGYAFPTVADRVFIPCPVSWQGVKNEEAAYDKANIANWNSSNKNLNNMEFRGINSYVYLDQLSAEGNSGTTQLLKYEPEKEVRMHHARPLDRSYGHALGSDHGPNMGQFYQYVALKKDQSFSGTLRGNIADLNKLLSCIKQNGYQLRLGRSRTAEYGNVTFKADSVASQPNLLMSVGGQRNPLNCFTIILLTPLVLADASGRVEANPAFFLEELKTRLALDIKTTELQLKFGTVSGYNSKWRMPKPQRPMLDVGSVFTITLEDTQTVGPEQIEQIRWGELTEEGYGQVKVIAAPTAAEAWNVTTIYADDHQQGEGHSIQDELQSDSAYEKLEKRISTYDRDYAKGRECAGKVKTEGLGLTKLHQLQDLFQSLTTKETLEKELQKMTAEEVKSRYKGVVEIFQKGNLNSKAFKDGYFRTLIWKVRGEKNE
ncbi:UNVERIFIED_CONTAM: CRISPR-associated protein Csx10 [Paenibacillus sp. PvR008]